MLPEPIETVVGSILHDVRAKFAEASSVGQVGNLSQMLKEVLRERETELRTSSTTACLTPIRQVFGARKWADVEVRLRKWSHDIEARQPEKRSATDLSSVPTSAPAISFGIERHWRVPALRLRGRPDEAVIAHDGVIEIIDFKSGNPVDREGVRSAIVLQLHLYALMAEHVTGRRVRLFVHGRQRVPIEWDGPPREAVVQRLSSLSAAYPAGDSVLANEVSRPGPHCVGCRLRSQCSRYLHDVPAWWPNVRDNPRPLPLDVWGVVRTLGEDERGSTLHLDDAAGRQVVVSGISPRHGVEGLKPNATVFAFGLAAGEDVFMHGRSLHPRAFHEISPSPRWTSARCPMFFVPPNEPPTS